MAVKSNHRVITIPPGVFDEVLAQAAEDALAQSNAWSEQAVAQLAHWYPRGVPVSVLAERLDGGRHSIKAVRNKVTCSGFHRAPDGGRGKQ